MALALLGLGEAAPTAFPVQVTIEGHGPALEITVDGQRHAQSAVVGPPWSGIVFETPGPLDREYQVDGSDTTATTDRQPSIIEALRETPLYQLDAWLRDEGRYSRWGPARITDLSTGAAVPADGPLPSEFRLEVALERPEAAARVWLVGAPGRREGLELDRDRRNARWLLQRSGGTDALPRWFFPVAPLPFVAELLHLLGRSAAAAIVLTAATVGLATLARALRRGVGGRFLDRRLTTTAAAHMGTRESVARGSNGPQGGRSEARLGAESARSSEPGLGPSWRLVTDLVLGAWFVAAALVATRVFQQLPHILDAVAYATQAQLFASGRLALDARALDQAAAFRGPFQVAARDLIFVQYPPGAAAAYALGTLVSLGWLVGPLAGLVLIGATSWTAGALYGPRTGVLVAALGALSPFILFQAGSFLSHPIAAGLLAGALAAFVKGERGGAQRWFALAGGLLGLAFLTREAASVLFAIPLGLRLVQRRDGAALTSLVACALPSVAVYLLYNTALTGSPYVLPRALFNPTDHFGFGENIGFHTRHTLAAGLANTDELLTILQFELFGWPPLVALGLLLVPFLPLGQRPAAWDLLAGLGVLLFVGAYAAYFYHGIALGPRYYFEAMPWLLLLAGRGAQVLARVARSRGAVLVVLGVLAVHTLGFYMPLEIQRRTDRAADGTPLTLDFIETSLLGPRLLEVPRPALIFTSDWWLYNTSLAALNCGRLPDCEVLYALAPGPDELGRLRAAYPGRTVLRAENVGGHVRLQPVP